MGGIMIRYWGCLLGFAGLALAIVPHLYAAETAAAVSSNPQQLVRTVVGNELRNTQNDHSHWMYRDHDIEPAKNVVKACVETSAGQLCRVLERDGHVLTSQEQEEEKQHIHNVVSNPAEQKKKQKAQQDDDRKAAELVNMLPTGFLYQYDGEEGDYTRLKFQPNPDFSPPSREAAVFHCMAGTILIDRRQKRLAGMKGTLIRNVDFGWGMLGRLNKGGTFEVKRQDVGDDHWVTTLLDVHIRGKALFFKTINAEQHEVTEAFKRVPDRLTLAQGASMLETPRLQASAKAGK
jgi:hypothetical protein